MEQTKEELIQLRDEAIQAQKELDAQIDKMDKEEAREKRKKHKQNLSTAKKHLQTEFNKLVEDTINKFQLDGSEFNFTISKNENIIIKKDKTVCPKFFFIDDSGTSHLIKGRFSNKSIWYSKSISFINQHKVTHSIKEDGEWKVWNEHAGEKPVWFNRAIKMEVDNVEVSHSSSTEGMKP